MTERHSRRFVVVLHADVVGSTALVHQDEALAHQRIQDLFRRLANVIRRHAGIPREIRGDALVAEFARPSDAVTAAVVFQSGNREHNRSMEGNIRPELRIGISLGEVIVADGTVTGIGVVLAQRLEQLALGGDVVIQGSVAETMPPRLPFEFENMGEHELKGFSQAVKACRVWIRPGGRIDPPETEYTERSADDPLTPGPRRLDLPDKPSIVVLPFTNMSSDPEQEYFSDGVCEDIITDLSKLSGLFVIARNSAFTYKGKAVNIAEVCLELGVRYVLEGSVRKSGNRLRITAQLIDGATSGHVWADRYDRELADIFAVQDEVTGEIVAALKPRLTPSERVRSTGAPTQSLEAYDHFMRGRELWWRFDREANREARELFQQAIDIDPQFAKAHAWLAASHLLGYVNHWDGEASVERHAHLARHSLTLDDRDAFAHSQMALAHMVAREYDQALAESARAIELDPNFAHARFDRAWVLLYAGRFSEALEALDDVERADPHIPPAILHIRALCHFHLGGLEIAVATIQERLARNPTTDVSNVLLASCLGHLGRSEEARAAWDRALRVNPHYSLEHKKQILVYRNPKDLEYFIDGLRKAGVAGDEVHS